jgi:hypothetical protein
VNDVYLTRNILTRHPVARAALICFNECPLKKPVTDQMEQSSSSKTLAATYQPKTRSS